MVEQRKGSVMQAVGKRIWVLIALGLLAVPVGATGVAYACTALATVTTSSNSAVAGSTITVAGKYFAPHDPADIRTTPAIIHMDRVDGPVIGQASPSSASTDGAFSVPVTVPTVDPGDHVLIVTQNGIDGRPAFGTPARAVLTVTAAPAPAVAVEPAPAAPVTPALLAPFIAPKPAAPTAPVVHSLAYRITSCKIKYKISAAKTRTSRKRVAAKRAACIRTARLSLS